MSGFCKDCGWTVCKCPPNPEGETRAPELAKAHDPVNHPKHYTSHPSGIEAIQITEHMNFNLGSAMKYLWRAGQKGDAIEDLRKCEWYINREIDRLTLAAKTQG